MTNLSYSTLKDDNLIAAALANNHAKFNSFSWRAAPQDSERWTVVYTVNRDSDLLTESNAAAIAELLQPFLDANNAEDMIHEERHSHWACGWVDGYAIRVYNTDGSLTEVFTAYCDILRRLDSYPALDEDDWSRREYESTIENIDRSEVYDHVRKNARDGWQYKVFGWLWDNNQAEVEPRDGFGAYPSEESIIAALKALHFHGSGWSR